MEKVVPSTSIALLSNGAVCIPLWETFVKKKGKREIEDVTLKIILNMDEKEVTVSWNGDQHKRDIPRNIEMIYFDRRHKTVATLLRNKD